MGLDWYVIDKMKEGKEDQEDRALEIRDIMNDFDGDPEGYMYQNLEKELKDLVITPLETLENEDDFPVDFRGKMIAHSEILTQESCERAYENHTPKGMLDYAIRLEKELEEYKIREIYDANSDGMSSDEKEDEYDIILRATKWLRFWADKGHGMNTWS